MARVYITVGSSNNSARSRPEGCLPVVTGGEEERSTAWAHARLYGIRDLWRPPLQRLLTKMTPRLGSQDQSAITQRRGSLRTGADGRGAAGGGESIAAT